MRLVTEYLSAQKSVSRIWLFGSLAKGRKPDWRSDIDIAVKGLEPSDLGCAWSELDARIPRPLDLVRWEDLRGFRRLFRHAYDFELDNRRLTQLLEDWRANRDAVLGALREFALRLGDSDAA